MLESYLAALFKNTVPSTSLHIEVTRSFLNHLLKWKSLGYIEMPFIG